MIQPDIDIKPQKIVEEFVEKLEAVRRLQSIEVNELEYQLKLKEERGSVFSKATGTS